MGDTKFQGRFELNEELDEKTYNFLVKFNEIRHMARKVDPEYGIEGEFYVDDEDNDEDNIIDRNRPSRTQPGLWCQWVPSENKKGFEWDEDEKFHHHIEWLRYIVKNFLEPKGYILNGRVQYQGDSKEDVGSIVIKDNVVVRY